MGENHHIAAPGSIPAPGSSYVVARVTGRGWVVLDPSRRPCGGLYPSRDGAQKRCDSLNAELDRRRKRGPRACLCCGQTFVSEGFHNRLCGSCRQRSDGGSLTIAANSTAKVRRAAKA